MSVCPVCKEELVLYSADGDEDPHVKCSSTICGFKYTERLENHHHAVVLEMNANTRRMAKAASAEAKLAQMFNIRKL